MEPMEPIPCRDLLIISWQLLKQQWRKLYGVFLLFWGVVLLLILLPLLMLSLPITSWINENGTGSLFGLLSCYLLWSCAEVFSASLLIFYIDAIISEQPISLSQAFRKTLSRTFSLLAFSAINATVGVILQALENSKNWLTSVLGWVIDIAWSTLNIFILPILLLTNQGIADSIRSSSDLIATLGGKVLLGFSPFFLIPLFTFVLCAGFVALAHATGQSSLFHLALLLALLLCLISRIVTTLWYGVFRVVLYRYATSIKT